MEKLVKNTFGIEDEDIVMMQSMGTSTKQVVHNDVQGTLYEPAFYLIVDAKEEKIVLAVRGSTSLNDIFTDLDAHADNQTLHIDGDTIEGYVHPGK